MRKTVCVSFRKVIDIIISFRIYSVSGLISKIDVPICAHYAGDWGKLFNHAWFLLDEDLAVKGQYKILNVIVFS